MPGIVVVGSQWGDEGKGKVTDRLADRMSMVVRYQGGNNAGHTVVNGHGEFKLHLLPSGVLYPHITPVIADGVVVDPKWLLDEVEGLEARGIDCSKLALSCNAHLIMPYHRRLDQATEIHLGASMIGTTGKGIGPCYADKAARLGMRVQDLTDMPIFKLKLQQVLPEKNLLLTQLHGMDHVDLDEIMEEYAAFGERLEPYIRDTNHLVSEALDNGEHVLFEGAQGTMLDIDHGTYPFVTSSSPVAGGACASAGVSPRSIEKIVGVVKAYTTRVGSGPFPTEDTDDIGEQLRRVGVEYGTTTGRPRRCGWLDAVIVRYAARLNGFTDLAITKLDVLSPMPTIKIATAYRYGDEVLDELPCHQSILHKVAPVYEELEGWQCDIGEVADYADLPVQARRYVARVAELAGVPVEMVSVGAKRDQTIEVPRP